jgi:DNA-binding LytR/AlgR family response regulator
MRIKDGFFYALIGGTSIALFLIIYQPFGTYEFQSDNKYLFLSGYGLIVFAVIFGVFLLRMWLVKPGQQIARHWSVVIVVLSFLLALIASFYYKQWYFQQPHSLTYLLDYLPYGMATALIPCVMVIVLSIRQHKATDSGRIVLVDNNGRDLLHIDPADVSHIKAADNYIEVHHRNNGQAETTLLRNTLAYAEQQLQDHPHIVRCHRSHLVNLNHVQKTTGPKDRLVLDVGSAQTIPVSRKMVDAVLHSLNQS